MATKQRDLNVLCARCGHRLGLHCADGRKCPKVVDADRFPVGYHDDQRFKAQTVNREVT